MVANPHLALWRASHHASSEGPVPHPGPLASGGSSRFDYRKKCCRSTAYAASSRPLGKGRRASVVWGPLLATLGVVEGGAERGICTALPSVNWWPSPLRSDYIFEGLPAMSICAQALAQGYLRAEPKWDDGHGYAGAVAEAKRRGYTPAHCAAVVNRNPLPLLGPALTGSAPNAAPVANVPVPTPDPLIVSVQTLLGVLGYGTRYESDGAPALLAQDFA
jgi:hypothetical protein